MSDLDTAFFKPFVDGTVNTLKIQCGLVSEHGKPFIKGTAVQPEFAIAGVIGITSEKFQGTITLCFPEKVFLGVLGKMLGEEFKSITDDLQDGAAELLNMIYGQAKIALNAQGHAIKKAIPTVIRGDNLQSRVSSKSRVMVLPFKTEFGEFHIEICSETSL